MIHARKPKSWRDWGRLIVLLLCLQGVALCTTATPAFADPHTNGGVPVLDPSSALLAVKMWAQRNSDWLEALGYLGKIITGIAEVVATVSDWMSKIVDNLKLSTLVKSAGQQAEVEAEKRLTQAELDAGPQNVQLRVAMEIASDNTRPRHEALCRSIMAHQLVLTIGDYEKEVSRFALSMIENRYLGDTADGSGPQFASDSFWARYKQKFCGPDYPSGCSDSSTKGADGRSLMDADFSFYTLDGGQPLQMTKLKPVTINNVDYKVPDPQNTMQKFWVAGLYYCYNMAGPRPTPAAGDKMLYPILSSARSFWDTLASKESDLAKPCTDLLAYYTRPNSDATKILDEQNKKCQAAKNQGIDVTAFDNCTNGLSPYETEKLELLLCKANQYFYSHSQAGATMPQMLGTVDKCTMGWLAWDNYRAKKIAQVVDGSMGLAKMRKLWGRISSGGAAMGMNAPANDDSSLKREAKAQAPAKPAFEAGDVKRIKEKTSSKRAFTKGVPVPADEMEWPEAVSQ